MAFATRISPFDRTVRALAPRWIGWLTATRLPAKRLRSCAKRVVVVPIAAFTLTSLPASSVRLPPAGTSPVASGALTLMSFVAARETLVQAPVNAEAAMLSVAPGLSPASTTPSPPVVSVAPDVTETLLALLFET
jgi:hypothetical protein